VGGGASEDPFRTSEAPGHGKGLRREARDDLVPGPGDPGRDEAGPDPLDLVRPGTPPVGTGDLAGSIAAMRKGRLRGRRPPTTSRMQWAVPTDCTRASRACRDCSHRSSANGAYPAAGPQSVSSPEFLEKFDGRRLPALPSTILSSPGGRERIRNALARADLSV